MTYTKEYEVDKSDRSFPSRLKIALNTSRITQKALAEYLDLSSAAISGWMRGSEPDYKTLRQIAGRLNVTTDYLLGLSDNMNLDTDYQSIGNFTGLSDGAIYNLNCLKSNFPIGGKALLGPTLISMVVSHETSPIFSTNLLLENRDLLLLFYEYLGVEEDRSEGCFKDMKANSILLQIQKELMDMRKDNHGTVAKSIKENIDKAFTARTQDNG